MAIKEYRLTDPQKDFLSFVVDEIDRKADPYTYISTSPIRLRIKDIITCGEYSRSDKVFLNNIYQELDEAGFLLSDYHKRSVR